jgi:hypothetical protein
VSELQILNSLENRCGFANVSRTINVDLFALCFFRYLRYIWILTNRFNQFFECLEYWSNSDFYIGIFEVRTSSQLANIIWHPVVDFEFLIIEKDFISLFAGFIQNFKVYLVFIFTVFSFFLNIFLCFFDSFNYR